MLRIEKEKKIKIKINIDLAVVASQWSEVAVHDKGLLYNISISKYYILKNFFLCQQHCCCLQPSFLYK